MYENLTGAGADVLRLSHVQAVLGGMDFVDTHHVLLAILADETNQACILLRQLGVEIDPLRKRIRSHVQQGPEVEPGNKPFSPRSKLILQFAMEEAKAAEATRVDTDMLLVGVIREEDGVGAMQLAELGVRLVDVREAILEMKQAREIPLSHLEFGRALVRLLCRSGFSADDVRQLASGSSMSSLESVLAVVRTGLIEKEVDTAMAERASRRLGLLLGPLAATRCERLTHENLGLAELSALFDRSVLDRESRECVGGFFP